ncbi:Fatty acid hydroxylase [Popillia japonica]|uniref:Alkylglycerol monooxygenase n=1 Tax=Popillia japonica TaxID=7064 RepID=A0AAW1LBJ5_POPJA
MEMDYWNSTSNGTEYVRSVFVKLANEDLESRIYGGSLMALKNLGRMFYVIDPSETTYRTTQQVPNFIQQAVPYFIIFILLENLLLWMEKKPAARLNDSITSISHGILQQCGRLIWRGAEGWTYIYIYENFRLFEAPWDSGYTWYAAALGIDFCYYWVHRACHEVHIFWAQHQVHHSSEDYNLTTALRQSVLQGWCAFIFYLPLAFAIPPSHFVAHQQFNLLYQFWIHTQAIKTLGPLEYILNTPKHHRVHHGSNLYCLDKNYGGVLIIWDRIFGTFAEEREGEEIIYGLVYNQPSFNPIHLQSFYTIYVFKKFQAMKNWKHKLAAVFYGPSWKPGKPRLGLDAEKPNIRSRKKYNVTLPLWCNLYLFVHFAVIVVGFQELSTRYMGMNPVVVFGSVVYIIASLTNIGLLFENKPYACILELLRCALLLTALQRLDFSDINGNIHIGVITLCIVIDCTSTIGLFRHKRKYSSRGRDFLPSLYRFLADTKSEDSSNKRQI